MNEKRIERGKRNIRRKIYEYIDRVKGNRIIKMKIVKMVPD